MHKDPNTKWHYSLFFAQLNLSRYPIYSTGAGPVADRQSPPAS